MIYKGEYFREINVIIFSVLLFFILFNTTGYDGFLIGLAVIYVIFNIFCSMIAKNLFMAWPVWIIRVTGFFRYVGMLFAAGQGGYIALSATAKEIMILELVAQYIAIFTYSFTPKGRLFIYNRETDCNGNDKSIKEAPSFKVGIPVVGVLVLAGGIVLSNRSLLLQYFSFSSKPNNIIFQNGIIALLVNSFFLLLYIISIKFIESLRIGGYAKIIFVVFISAFFINGTSITKGNVSRWSLVITMFVAYNYLVFFHPREKKLIGTFGAVVAIVIGVLGTMMKFSIGNSGYETFVSTIHSSFSYKMINAYFSGPDNIETAVRMNAALSHTGIMYKINMSISDIFNNFPLLNKILSVKQNTSVYWFNITYYGSTIARDQIIPLAGQLYNYLGYLFFIPEILLIFTALNVNYKLRVEKDMLKIYCLSYFCFSLSLVNCINAIIMCQNIWIQILPPYIVYKINKKIK